MLKQQVDAKAFKIWFSFKQSIYKKSKEKEFKKKNCISTNSMKKQTINNKA